MNESPSASVSGSKANRDPNDLQGLAPAIGDRPQRQLLRWPVVCLVTDRSLARQDFRREVAEAVKGGVNLLQLREKDLPTRELLELAVWLRNACEGIAITVNGRPDVAFAAGVDGVHLPTDSIPPALARRTVGSTALVGRSVHSLDEIVALRHEPVDYVELGTVFPSRSHPGGATCGLAGVRAASQLGMPVLGIGGITPQNAAGVIEAGALGVAVISAILGQPRPREAARRLTDAVQQAWTGRARPVEAVHT